MSLPIGVLVRDLGPSELSWRLLRHSAGQRLAFFQESFVLPAITPSAPVVSAAEAWGYPAPLIATTFGTAAKLLSSPGKTLKVFYAWDLDWVRFANLEYRELASVYGDPRLPIVCRHADHLRLIEDVWRRPVAGVVADANPAEILAVAERP